MKIALIAAVADNGAIGRDNQLLWHLPADMRFFKETTTGHTILTGRKNYESIPERFRPLPNRTNLIVTRQMGFHEPGAFIFSNIEGAVTFARKNGENLLFVVGGGEIYRQCLPLADILFLTRVKATPQADTFFEIPDPEGWLVRTLQTQEADVRHAFSFQIEHWERS